MVESKKVPFIYRSKTKKQVELEIPVPYNDDIQELAYTIIYRRNLPIYEDKGITPLEMKTACNHYFFRVNETVG